jgi:uncharacterized membrane protein
VDSCTVENLSPVGRAFCTISIIAFGVLHPRQGGFATRPVPTPGAAIPGRAAVAYLVGAVLVAAGGAILARFRTREVSLALGGLLFLSVIGIYLPRLLPQVTWGDVLTNTLKVAALGGGALTIARSVPGRGRIPPVDRVLFALFLVVCGIEHFLFAVFVATLVPAWMPGGGRCSGLTSRAWPLSRVAWA